MRFESWFILYKKSKPNLFSTQQVELFEPRDKDPTDLSAGAQQIVIPPKKKGKYLRQIYGLKGSSFVKVPRHQPLNRFYEFGILPNSKYSFDVYLEIASLIKHSNGERCPQEIAQILRAKYQSLEKAMISRVFVKKVISITSAVMFPMLPQFANLPQSWTLMIDSTIRVAGEFVLVVVLAVSQDYTFPLLATFLPSENTTDLLKLLGDLKQSLPHQPQAVISDFSKGFLTAIKKTFPSNIQLGCHFHALEIFARILLNPVMKSMRKLILPLLRKLKNWAKQTIFTTATENFELRSFARSIVKLQEKGNFGQRLLNVSQQLLAIHDALQDNSKLIVAQPYQIKRLKIILDKVMRSDGSKIRIAISRLKAAIGHFQMIRNAMSADSEPKQLLRLVERWKKNKDLLKVAEKIEELAPYLLPAIKDDQLPRTTSILESLHGSVKKTLRKWSGNSTPSSSFDWIAPLLSVLDGLDEMQWQAIYTQLPAEAWYKELYRWREREKLKKLEVRNAGRLVKLGPEALSRQVRILLGKVLVKEVMN